MSTQHTALIVAHGSPSDQETQELALAELAASVNALLPEWKVGSATLAVPDSFERMADRLGKPVVYPFFMAQGWFISELLKPKADIQGLRMLSPFGVEEALVECSATMVEQIFSKQEMIASNSSVLIAAHGSKVSKTSANSALKFRQLLHDRLGLKESRCGFIEQEPFLADVAKGMENAICLPYLALDAGHMTEDIPQALQAAKFSGPVLPPFIQWPQTAQLIAASLQRQILAMAGEWQ